jgi:hypothetical protein
VIPLVLGTIVENGSSPDANADADADLDSVATRGNLTSDDVVGDPPDIPYLLLKMNGNDFTGNTHRCKD